MQMTPPPPLSIPFLRFLSTGNRPLPLISASFPACASRVTNTLFFFPPWVLCPPFSASSSRELNRSWENPPYTMLIFHLSKHISPYSPPPSSFPHLVALSSPVDSSAFFFPLSRFFIHWTSIRGASPTMLSICLVPFSRADTVLPRSYPSGICRSRFPHPPLPRARVFDQFPFPP